MYSALSPYRIITVCTGNICRSPMAQLMLTEAFDAGGLGEAVVVDSAGTTSYEAGHPIDPRAARVLSSHRIRSEGHIARILRPEWFRERDLILALDVDHYGWLHEAAPDSETLAKIRMLRSFDPAVVGRSTLDLGIEDPWYGGHHDFDVTWDLIRAAVPGIVAHTRETVAARQHAQQHDPQQVRSIS